MRRSTRKKLHIVPALLMILNVGCSRTFFRQAADKDVEGVITEKNKFPDWDTKSWHVYPDPRSRFADASNPDRPPYPPDDYAARVLSPNPQHPTNRTGTGRVDGDGYLKMLEEWNAKNRADDPANARGVPPDSLSGMILYKSETTDQATLPNPIGSGVAGSATVASPSVSEPSPWMSARSAISTPAPAPASKPSSPRVIESRDSTVIPASGTEEANPSVVVASTQPPGAQSVPIPNTAPGQLPPPKTESGAFPGAKSDPGAGEFPSIEKLLITGNQREDYLRALTTNERGFRIKLDQAVELGIVNAREMQDQREALYFAALPVTLERFNLAAQGFFTEQLLRTSLGNQLSPSGQSLSSTTTPGISKLFPTGALLLVQMANQVVINFGAGQPVVALSNLSLNLTQPFLAGGGFAVTLEPLTQAERTLLYAMRSFTRFRKVLYVSIATGGGLTNNPYGLPGLSENLGRGIGENLTAPTIGFLPILQSGAIVINNKKNVETLERYLRQYQAYREGGQLSDLQVGLVEVQMLNTRAIFLGSIGTTGAPGSVRGYLDAIDNFKLQLGIPETVALDLDIGPLKPIHKQLTKYERIYADVREVEDLAHRFNPNDPANSQRPRWRRLLTESNLVKGTAFAKGIGERWDSWAKLTDDQLTLRLGDLRKERADLLDRHADRQLKGQPDPEAETRKIAQLESEIDLALFEREMRKFEKQPWLKEKAAQAQAVAKAGAYRDTFNAFYQVILESRNERLEVAHAEWPKLPAIPVFGVDALTAPLDEAYTACIQGALSTRLDLMDARGQVVDAWRQIAVSANALQGVLNVGYNMSATGTTSNPVAYSGDRTQNQLVINAQLPLVRRAQRNAYRTALINYQSTRRLLMAFEDNIANDVRNDIRQLRALAEVYKIQQRVVEQSYMIVENAAEVLFAPPVPGTVLDPVTAAALTTQLLQALSGLLTAQNTLYTYWVNFLTNRIQIYLDLELMQLDERGIWRDEQFPGLEDSPTGPSDRQPGERLPAPAPVGPAALPDRK
ncbi:MAG TPA: TolC family protein [Gemmata sp.]|nr:TolC family protein [Gemmata sp.]